MSPRPTAAVLPAALLLAACLLVAGCSRPPATASYFPLEAGHRWQYEQTSEWDNQTRERETVVIEALGEAALPQGGSGWRRRSASGVDWFLRSDATGTYRVAAKHDLQAEPEPDAAPRYVLKLPLAVGTGWQATTTAYLLRRNAEFPPEIRHTASPVPMTYQIHALGQTVDTRAGRFTDCLEVRGSAVMRLYADPVVGFRDMPLDTREWYCKGVGLVRLERREPTNNATFLQGGTLVMELSAWQ